MKIEKKSFEEYWNRVGELFGIEDTIEMTEFDESLYPEIKGWKEGDEIIEFKDSCGCLLNVYNKDREEIWYV